MINCVSQAIERLNQLLPLKERQKKLSESLKTLHQAVIQSLVMRGCALSRSEIVARVGEDKVEAAIARLGHDDLVVLSMDQRQIVGAYPVTLETTQHELHVSGHTIHAMCALDALSVGPMFELPVVIRSRCRVSGESVCIKQDGIHILAATPPSVRVGVRWQMPSGDANLFFDQIIVIQQPLTSRRDNDLLFNGLRQHISSIKQNFLILVQPLQ